MNASGSNAIETIEEEDQINAVEILSLAFARLRLYLNEKKGDYLLSVLNSSAKHVKQFLAIYYKILAIERFLLSRKSNENKLKGFRKQKIQSSDGKSGLIFLRDLREVIRLQMSSASLAVVIVKPIHAGVISHPMNFYVGTKACVVVEHAVKTDPHRSAT